MISRGRYSLIIHIWLTFDEARPNWLESNGSAQPDEIVLRMYWDDARESAVEAPLGDFFGAGFGLPTELNHQPMMPTARHSPVVVKLQKGNDGPGDG